MAYNYNDYANSNSSQFIQNYTGNVKYYCFIQNQKTDYQFVCQNATFRIDNNGNIQWKHGIWKSGIWYNGVWENQIFNNNIWENSENIVSVWECGQWYNGTWENGQWYNGLFYGGNFYNGLFYNGVFGYNNLIQKSDIISVWHDGYFFGGLFCGTYWYNGYYYTDSFYFFNYKNDINTIWLGGYIDDKYSSSAPKQILSNNIELYNSTKTDLYYFKIKDNSFVIKQLKYTNSDFKIDKIGKITTYSGYFYDCSFENDQLNNTTIQSSENIKNCICNNCNIRNSNLIDCIFNNNSNNNTIIEHCQIENGIYYKTIFDYCDLTNIIFNSGIIRNSLWRDGIFNNQQNLQCYWQSNSIWYSGVWNSGYIDNQLSEIAPYIVGNSLLFENYTGDLSYYYQNNRYIITIKDSTLSFSNNGNILFENGTFLNGIFMDGSFYNSNWQNGQFNGGVFNNSNWQNGQFNGGVFDSSNWYNGNFNNGTFQNSNWYNGNFNNGNWITLGSFWFGGNWINGLQNNASANLNIVEHVLYIHQNQLESHQFIESDNPQKKYLTNRVFKLNNQNTQFNLSLYDINNKKIQIKMIYTIEDFQNDFGYYIRKNIVYIYFKNTIDGIIKIKYNFDKLDFTPSLKLIDDYLGYLQSAVQNRITGQFDYTVHIQQNTYYYTIKVQDANFTIKNGYIYWNCGTFLGGTWYDGQWNLPNNLNDIIEPTNTDFVNILDRSIWSDGIWMNGNWNITNSQWIIGTWVQGTINNISSTQPPCFEFGNNKKYIGYTGRIKYIYNIVEQDQIISSHFAQCELQNANIEFSSTGFITFNGGIWENGYFYNGIFKNISFQNNVYEQDIEQDYNGYKIKECVWKNGTWENGQWHNGTWENGIWKNGLWSVNNKYIKYSNDQYYVEQSEGSYVVLYSKYIKQEDIPDIGFFIYDYLTGDQDFSNDLTEEYTTLIDICIWKNNKWIDGFFNDAKSNYPPIYKIANGYNFYNQDDSVLYKVSIYENNEFYEYRLYLLNFTRAVLNIDQNGFIVFYQGDLYNSVWYNGEFNGGTFKNSVWYNGVWNNGYFYTRNSTIINCIWNIGFIDGIYSEYSPVLITGNNCLFLNYTGQLKYKTENKFCYLDVSNACFVINNNGYIIFYKGIIQGGQFNGLFKTSNINSLYCYFINIGNIIKLDNLYVYNQQQYYINYQYDNDTTNDNDNKQNYYTLSINNEESQTIELFVDYEQYISSFKNANFNYGIWKNGQWISGTWNNIENNIWKQGLINGILQYQPPIYLLVSFDSEKKKFINYTGQIKYRIDYVDKTLDQVIYKNNVFSVNNATFDIQYIKKKHNDTEFYQPFIYFYYGEWLSGEWHNGIWENGQWRNGNWRTGIWQNGRWHNGNWVDGMWYNGWWLGGKKENIRILNQIF